MNIETLLSLVAKAVVLTVCAIYLIYFSKNKKKTWVSYLVALWAVGIIISQSVILIRLLAGQ